MHIPHVYTFGRIAGPCPVQDMQEAVCIYILYVHMYYSVRSSTTRSASKEDSSGEVEAAFPIEGGEEGLAGGEGVQQLRAPRMDQGEGAAAVQQRVAVGERLHEARLQAPAQRQGALLP